MFLIDNAVFLMQGAETYLWTRSVAAVLPYRPAVIEIRRCVIISHAKRGEQQHKKESARAHSTLLVTNVIELLTPLV